MQTALFKKTAVLIEDNSVQSSLYSDVLIATGFDVRVTKSPMEGLIKIKEKAYDLAVINMEIAEESFVEKLIQKIRTEKNAEFMPIIGLSIYSEENKKNISKNVDALLTKPISIDRFVEFVFSNIENRYHGSKNFDNERRQVGNF
ncbi:MAG: response regulator [Holosporaceae bacterium]|nr:response regulator [Holosporaceae bacterium]